MKKIIFISLIFVILITLFIISGGKRTDVALKDFNLSEDGNKITLNTIVASSTGYIRTLKVKQGGDNKYITFYSTFGINNPIGAKDSFEIDLNSSCDEIYFYKGDGGYKLVLQKENKEWKLVK